MPTSDEDLGDTIVLSDFTVAAEKTVEKPTQKIPLSISVIGSEQILTNGITDATGLTNYVPNIQIGRSGVATEIAIRGIGSTNNTEVGDPAGGFVVDGVGFGRPESAGAGFFDIERVDVLRGPQGTLYGRNTIAGSVNVVTRKPEPTLGGSASLSFGNYDALRFEGVVNAPLNDWIAMRAAYAMERHDGYTNARDPLNSIIEDTDNADSKAFRLHTLFTPSEDLSILVTGNFANRRGSYTGLVMRPLDGSTPSRTFVTGFPNVRDDTTWSVSSEINKRFSNMTLTYVGGYRKADRDAILLGVITPLPNPFVVFGPFRGREDEQNHELRLASNTEGRFEWVGGVFYYKENNDVTLLLPSLSLGFVQPEMLSESRAIFGQTTYKLTDRLRLIGGLRFTRDHKARIGGQFAVNEDGMLGQRYSENDADRTWSSTDFKAGLEYDVGDRSMLYATVSTGYKAGGFFDGAGDVYYEPEEITSYEIGWKNRFLDNRLQVNVTAFHYEYKNFQVSSVELTPSSGQLGTFTRNIPTMPLDGVEIENSYQISRDDRLDLNISYLQSEFKNFVVGATDINGTFIQRDLSGNELAKAPNWTVQLSYSKTFTLPNRGTITWRLNSRWVDGYYISFDNHPIAPSPVSTWQPSFTTTDTMLTYDDPERRWYFGIFVRNIEDEIVMSTTGGSAVGDTANLEPPRTYGFRMGTKF